MIELPEDMDEELKDSLRRDELIYGNAYFSRMTIVRTSGERHNTYERVDPMTIEIANNGKQIVTKDPFIKHIDDWEKELTKNR